MDNKQKIAIVGVSCRFPGCYDQASLWSLYQQQKTAITEIPPARWSVAQHYTASFAKNKSLSRWAGLISGFERFDAPYFNVLPREAELMDPQQRMTLELAVECFEDAGYSLAAMDGSQTGVFMGVCNFDYKERLEKSGINIQGHLATGTYTALIPNRVSFYLNLKGPSVSVDTACSGSLVALSSAMQAIHGGDCEAALVGGVSYLFSHTYFVAFSQAGMLSPTGKCQPFAKEADGYVRGEGGGIILIKPLTKALQDNDKIYGVIDAVAVNHGGRVATITSPSAWAQGQVIKKALHRAGVSVNSISCIETHGTGTPKGDPVEINGLKRAFRAYAKESGEDLARDFCVISASKANIGHLESASGMVGLIKGLLAIQKRRLLPIMNLKQLNPKIDLTDSPFRLLTAECAWEPECGIRRFGVSCFGFGGVNAHAIVSEYPNSRNLSPVSDPQLFAFSASSPQALRNYALLISHFLQTNPQVVLHHCAYTLARRSSLSCRFAVIYQTRQQLLGELVAFANGIPAKPLATEEYSEHEKVTAWLKGEQESVAVLFSPHQHRIVYVPPYPFQHATYFPEALVLPEPAHQQQAPQDCATATLCQIEPLFSPVTLPDDASIYEKRWQPVVFSLLGKKASSTLQHYFPASHYIELARLPANASAQAWLSWYLNFLALLIKSVDWQASCGWLLLTDKQEPWASTLYAHALALEKECGLPCGWYQFANNALSALQEQDKKHLLRPFRHSFCCQLAQHADKNTLTVSALRYQVKPFPRTSLQDEALAEHASVLISGGAGGIGNLFAKYLANTFAADVVILGRKTSNEIAADCLVSQRGTITYIQADCCDRHALTCAIEQTLSRHQRIDLIIHSAGAINDKSMFDKSESDIRQVVESKVIGCELLDELTRSLPVKQFIVFSSITALLGNPGQTDYAAANQYLVEFVHRRNKQQAAGQCFGRATAIYWPYWRDGGMRITHSAQTMLQQTTGTEPLLTDEGIAIFNHALRQQPAEMCVVRGVAENITRTLNHTLTETPAITDRGALTTVILSVIADITGLPPEAIALKSRFSELGIDSIAMQSVARELSQATGAAINGVVLAKNPTVHKLAEYLTQRAAVGQTESDQPSAHSTATLGESHKQNDIAVIGLDLRMCHTEQWRDAWPLLSQKRLTPEIYPLTRWQQLPAELTRNIARDEIQGYFIKDCLAFDHKFFAISRREAMLMDPQHRLLIESVYAAITDAGYSPAQFSQKNTAVLVCIDANDYSLIAEFDASLDEFSCGASTPYLSANRLSHLFNLKGPSEIVNVACASVYCAVEKAQQLINSGVVDQVVIAASQINLLPSRFKALEKRGLLSRDGVVAPFDKAAHGFIRSEGVGCILLKNLQMAVADNDEVIVKVKSAASWHGGRGDAFTAPNALTHLTVMNRAFRQASGEIKPLQYIEAHGIASPVGDLSEAEAIATFLSTSARGSCAVSSMKSNVGHLEVCSGIAGFVRAILAIRQQHIPGIPQLQQLHENIDRSQLHFSSHCQPFTTADSTIGLLAYGLGAVSAFVLLEPFIGKLDTGAKAPPAREEAWWFCLSAPDAEALTRYVTSVIEQIKRYREMIPLPQLITTLRFHRQQLAVRLAINIRSYDELLSKLQAWLAGELMTGVFTSQQCQDDSEIVSTLPPEIHQWLERKECDEIITRPQGRRSFWPQYPFDRSSILYIQQQGEIAH